MPSTLADWEAWRRRCGVLHSRGLSRRLRDDLLTMHGSAGSEDILAALESLSDDAVRRFSQIHADGGIDLAPPDDTPRRFPAWRSLWCRWHLHTLCAGWRPMPDTRIGPWYPIQDCSCSCGHGERGEE